MRKGRRLWSLSCGTWPGIGLALRIVLAVLFVFGSAPPVHAQWLSPDLIYSSLLSFLSPPSLSSSLSSASPSSIPSASSLSSASPLSSTTSLSLMANAGFPSWAGLFYPQPLWAAPSWLFPVWQGLPSACGWLGSSLVSSSPDWGLWPMFLQDPFLYGMALPLIQDTIIQNTLMNPLMQNALVMQNALAAAWAKPLSAGLLRGAASASPPGDRRAVGIESKLIQYKAPAIRSARVSYVPGIPAYVPNQVVVTFQPGTPSVEVGRVCAKHRCRETYTSPYGGYTVLSTSGSTTALQAALRLRTEASVLIAEPNYLRYAHLVPNDPYYKYQWHLPRLNCNYAWDFTTGAGAMVGLLDSGVAFETNGIFTQAPDLAGTLFAPGYDFVNKDPYPDDDYGHGTHMAGCIAQTTNNLLGTAGVAFNATIMPVKVMDDIGGVVISTEVEGIYFAANSGAKVISMSLGGPGTSATEAAAITYAYNTGVTVICSAGNAGSSTPEYPASYTEPVSVSSIRHDYTLPSYSNYGQTVDVCAPGGDLSVDQNLDGFGDGILQQTHNGTDYATFYYYFMEGTSPACALVSGVAALIIAKSTIPLTAPNVVSILQGSVTDLGTTGWDQYFGYGLVNAYLAVLKTP